MKKNLIGLFVFAFILFIPFTIFAEEKQYEYFNFKYERVNGESIRNTEVKIFASVEGDENNLIDRTDELKEKKKMWSVCTEVDCTLSEEVAFDAVWEENKEYIFMIRITAKNGASIDVWGTDKAMLNGTPIENLDGEFGNTGSELMIKSKTSIKTVIAQEVTPTDETPEVIAPSPEPVRTCMLGLSLCCTTFLGISICIWILIAVLIILLIIIVCVLKNKKEEPQQPIQQ